MFAPRKGVKFQTHKSPTHRPYVEGPDHDVHSTPDGLFVGALLYGVPRHTAPFDKGEIFELDVLNLCANLRRGFCASGLAVNLHMVGIYDFALWSVEVMPPYYKYLGVLHTCRRANATPY